MSPWQAPEHNPLYRQVGGIEDLADFWDEDGYDEEGNPIFMQVHTLKDGTNVEARGYIDTERYDAKLDMGIIPLHVSQKKFWTVMKIRDDRGPKEIYIPHDYREDWDRSQDMGRDNPSRNVENAEKFSDKDLFTCLVKVKGRKRPVASDDIMELPSSDKDRHVKVTKDLEGELDGTCLVTADDRKTVIDNQQSELSYQKYRRSKAIEESNKEREAFEKWLDNYEKKDELRAQRLVSIAKFKHNKGLTLFISHRLKREFKAKDRKRELFNL